MPMKQQDVHDPFQSPPGPPRLLVTVVPLRLGAGGLEVALLQRPGGRSGLIKDRPQPDESLDLAARRVVRECLGNEGHYFEQLYTFNRIETSESDVVVGHMSLFRQQIDQPDRTDVRWTLVKHVRPDDDLDRLVLDYARVRLRAKLSYTNIAFHLLPEAFTLTELQQAYEHVLDHPVDKRNFRRRMTAAGILDQIDRKRRAGSHRPAALYRFAAQDNHAAYLTPSWAAQRETGGTDRNAASSGPRISSLD